MITLTTPVQIAVTLGSGTTTPYQKVTFTTAAVNVSNGSISGTCILSSTSSPTSQPVPGNYNITTISTPQLSLTVADLSFATQINLTGAQATAVQGWITTLQNSIEQGVVAVGAVAGTQTTGQ